MTLQKFIVYAVVILRMMFFDIVCFYSFLMMTIVLINTSNGLSVPAGLRPAKKVGDPREQIVPGKEQQQQREQQQQQQQQQQQLQEEEQQQQQQHDEVSNLRPTPKVPPNLSIRSRMMAALSASPVEPNKEKNSSKVETDSFSKPPIIFSKGNKKTVPGKIAPSGSSKGNARVIVAPPADLGKNNYGLNTVLQTNLVDSHGRIMKNVNSVPIKVPSSAEMKNARTRHTARQVESDADKVVPIKFGSTSRRR
ncbi:Disintegrin and metalloproteinase domain-containing protein [Dirofilaria immitis]